MKRTFILLSLVLFIIQPLSSCISPTSQTKSQRSKMATATKELGEVYLAQGNYTAALNEFIKAEKIIPDDPYLHNDLGLTYMAKKRFDLAEHHFKKAVTLNPDYVPAKNNLGSSYLKQKKWDSAIEYFKEISDNLLYATPHYPLSNLGWAYLGKNSLKLAEHYFSRALEEQPEFINAIHGLATVYLKTSNLQSALHLINKGIKNNSGTAAVAVLYADLARIYEKSGQHGKAKASWRKVIEVAPDSALAEEAGGKFRE